MTDDDDLTGYLFDLLDPDAEAAVAARLAADPVLAARLGRLRAALAPVLAERAEPPEPPPGLATRALAAVAAFVVETEPRPLAPTPPVELARTYASDPPTDLEPVADLPPGFIDQYLAAYPAAGAAEPARPPAPPPADRPEFRGGRFRADLLVAACIAFVSFVLVTSGIAKARHQQRVYACQNGLRTLHTGLAGYADADPQGRYPQALPTADAFATVLADMGHLPAGFKPACPATADCRAYTYALGFRGPNDELVPLRRPNGTDPLAEGDVLPIAADSPAAGLFAAGPVSPHAACMNVLFVGGHVRATTSPLVGPNGDDIYRNLFGQVAAGANRGDAVLGGPGTRP